VAGLLVTRRRGWLAAGRGLFAVQRPAGLLTTDGCRTQDPADSSESGRFSPMVIFSFPCASGPGWTSFIVEEKISTILLLFLY
jgi:hypothetical protein